MGAFSGMIMAERRHTITPGAAAAQVDRSESEGAKRPALHGGSITDADRCWRQVLVRDGSATFLYAVTTTGIFCRPGCPSRRPALAHVLFFPDAGRALAAGFRACLRCEPLAEPRELRLVMQLAAYLEQHSNRTVSLAELANVAGNTGAAVRRAFVRTLGLTPKAWAKAQRAEAYRALLAGKQTSGPGGKQLGASGMLRITDAVYEAGFSSPSRAHASAPLGMEARRYRSQGAGERIGYVVGEAPAALGKVLVAATGRGVCAVLLGEDTAALFAELKNRFPQAALIEEPALATHLLGVLAHLAKQPAAGSSLPLDLRGTAFQARVWAALRTIPHGETRSYAQLAEAVGAPQAVRAVAAACGQNPVAIVVPCHRVVGSKGALTGYRWGLERKQALLAWERTSAK